MFGLDISERPFFTHAKHFLSYNLFSIGTISSVHRQIFSFAQFLVEWLRLRCEHNQMLLLPKAWFSHYTVCPRSPVRCYVASHYIKMDSTTYTYYLYQKSWPILYSIFTIRNGSRLLGHVQYRTYLLVVIMIYGAFLSPVPIPFWNSTHRRLVAIFVM